MRTLGRFGLWASPRIEGQPPQVAQLADADVAEVVARGVNARHVRLQAGRIRAQSVGEFGSPSASRAGI